jgi:hypothetical protein
MGIGIRFYDKSLQDWVVSSEGKGVGLGRWLMSMHCSACCTLGCAHKRRQTIWPVLVGSVLLRKFSMSGKPNYSKSNDIRAVQS